MENTKNCVCYDCGTPYGGPRFPDLILPDDVWVQISPTGDEGGLLCPCCINARLTEAGIEGVFGRFASGPMAIDPAPGAIAQRIDDAITLAADTCRSEIHALLCEARDLLARRDAEARELRAELARVREIREAAVDVMGNAIRQESGDYVVFSRPLNRLIAALSQPAAEQLFLGNTARVQEAAEKALDELERLTDDELESLIERESLPLMSPKTAARVLNDEAQRPLGRRYRVTDTDEDGLPVVPREPGMPEGARYRGWTESTQRWSYYTRYIKRHAHDRFERIEDYRPAQESGDA